MIITMCEDVPADKMPEIVAINSEPVDDVITVNFLHNDDDVEAIKARLKEVPGLGVETFSSSDNEDSEKDSLEVNCDTDTSYEGPNSLDEQSVNCKSDGAETVDSLCQSTETLIDQLDSTASNLSMELSLNRSRNLSGPSSEAPSNTNDAVAVATSKSVTSGLLISPTSLSPLTQDVHVQMGDDSKRMSTVLDSLDLHLVYIPKTQQLVNARSDGEKIKNAVVNGDHNKTDGTDAESVSSGSLSATSSSLKGSPMKMATSSSGAALQILNPGGLDDSSSVCETDFLIRVQEPDQRTCDSSEFVCNFPRINTNDSLLRTFTDASSLSSLSTGTDFSVSAASLDEGDGTGHCIDTGDGGFMEINLHTRNSFERNKNPSQDSGFEDKSNKPKRKGLTSFLTRNIFSRKSNKDSSSSDGEGSSQPGWKLFGKVPLKQVPNKDPNQIEVEFKLPAVILLAEAERKQDLRELKLLQKNENKQYQDLIYKAQLARETQDRKFEMDMQSLVKNYDQDMDTLTKQQKQQVEKAESSQSLDLRAAAKRIKQEQERELKSFKEKQKQDLKLMKQELDMLAKTQRKEDVRKRKEQKDIQLAEEERQFQEQQQERMDKHMKQLTETHRQKIAMLESQFLQQKQQLLRAREAAIWELEKQQLHEKHQLAKSQLKDMFFLKRHQMLTRHQKEVEQMKGSNVAKEEEMQHRHVVERKRLPKILKQEAKTRSLMFKQSLRLSIAGNPEDERSKLKQFEENEKKRMKAEQARQESKHKKQWEELVFRNETSLRELEQLQAEKRKMLMEHETQKIKELDEQYSNELREWKAMLIPRKQRLEDEFAKQREEQEKFYGPVMMTGAEGGVGYPGGSMRGGGPGGQRLKPDDSIRSRHSTVI